MSKEPNYYLIPMLGTVVFPHTTHQIRLDLDWSTHTQESLLSSAHCILGFLKEDVDSADDITIHSFHPLALKCEIIQSITESGFGYTVLLEGDSRVRITQLNRDDEAWFAKAKPVKDKIKDLAATQKQAKGVFSLCQNYVDLFEDIPKELVLDVMDPKNPGLMTDLMASYLPVTYEKKLELFLDPSVNNRLDTLTHLLNQRIIDINMDQDIDDILDDRIAEEKRRELLEAKLRAIRQELGNNDIDSTIDHYQKRLKDIHVVEESAQEINKEIQKLQYLSPESEEAASIKNYLDFLFALPWKKPNKNRYQIKTVQSILDKHHYGLNKVKQRILEYLAVRNTSRTAVPQVLCLIGPPGVGKTSIVKSIAAALNQSYVPISLAGMRDESSLRGHRRTYVAALPGKLISALYKTRSNSPVILLDEIDKMASGFTGDPASVLLEILDPEQNSHFMDHYLHIPFDLSNILFICTANNEDEIPGPLKDRLELIHIPGYGIEEKVDLTRDYLIPKFSKQYRVPLSFIKCSNSDLKHLIVHYTKDVGLRELNRIIDSIFRHIVYLGDHKTQPHLRLNAAYLEAHLGPGLPKPNFSKKPSVGRSIAVYSDGVSGNILPIEALATEGTGQIRITGNVSPLLQETISTSISHLKHYHHAFNLEKAWFQQHDLHIHFGKPAIEKKGEGWGLAVFAAILSSILEIPLPSTLGFAGQITLLGEVLPTASIEQKCLAASQLGLDMIVISEIDYNDHKHALSQSLKTKAIRVLIDFPKLLASL